MKPNEQKTEIKEQDVALWIGQEVMNKNIIIKQLTDEISRLNRIIEKYNESGTKVISGVK